MYKLQTFKGERMHLCHSFIMSVFISPLVDKPHVAPAPRYLLERQHILPSFGFPLLWSQPTSYQPPVTVSVPPPPLTGPPECLPLL